MKKITSSYNRFSIVFERTKTLIEIGGIGVTQKSKEADELIQKLGDIEIAPNQIELPITPKIEAKRINKSGDFNLEMDEPTAKFMKAVLSFGKQATDELHHHLYSMYLVYIWGAFESYITMIFEELFKINPRLLKSKSQISYDDVIDNKDNILLYLMDQELEKINHFNVDKHLNYLESKLNFSISDSDTKKLQDLYLLRNIIAHNTGVVQTRYKSRIPSSIKIKKGELLIDLEYLKSEMTLINKIVMKLDKHIVQKFNIPTTIA